MLDAFIIEKIRREEAERESDQLPLRIEISQERQQDSVGQVERIQEHDRGIAIIDYSV